MVSFNWIKVGLVLALISVGVSCSKEEPPVAEGSPVLVRMGDGFVITVDDLNAESARLRANGTPVPSQVELLDQLIEFNAQVLKARFQGLEDDAQVKRRMEKVLVRALRKEELSASNEEILEEDLRSVYEAQIATYTKPSVDRLAVLVLKKDKNVSPQKCSELRVRMEEAKGLADQQPVRSGRGPSLQGFAQLSINYSDDQISRYRGGDMGWTTRTTPSARMPEKIWRIGVSLEKGAVSDVVEIDDGFYLIKKTDTRPEEVTPFEKVKPTIRQTILAERRLQSAKVYLEDCIEWASPQMDSEQVATLLKKTERAKESPQMIPKMGSPLK